MHHVSSMTNPENNEALELACAASTLVMNVTRFREAQHRVLFQMTNPSLSFPYEFDKSGKEMEAMREQLANSLETVRKLSWRVIYKHNKDEDNA